MLSNLESLILEFECPCSLPDSEGRSLLPPKRSILPALVKFHFGGVVEYLEQLVTHIDAPQLDQIRVTFFVQIDFYCPRLAQFINCRPAFRECDEAHMRFGVNTASVALRYRASTPSIFDDLQINISCRGLDQQFVAARQLSHHPIAIHAWNPFSEMDST